MVNTKCDTSYYDSRGYQRKIFDGNVLYESKAKAMKGSDWKPQVQRFNMTYLLELSKMQRDLENMEYEFLPTTNFTLHERGKLRRITGEQVQDRIVKHALCDEVLNPLIEPHLIYDNGASVVGKGIAFTRKRLLTHLRKYYAQHGSNEGYILLICGCFISTSRQASCNYGIGTDGRISMSVEEKNRSWCSSSRENDQRAVTIECASDKTAPYAFNDAVYASLVNLCVDICQRNGKSKLLWLGDKDKTLAYAPKSDEMVLTVHRWFANKSCPGDWLYNRLGNLAAEVTKRLTGGSTNTGKVDVPSDGKTLYRVQTGAFSKRSNADAWAAKLKAAGFDTYIVQMGNLYKVQVGAYSQKSNAENMMVKLKAAGYDAFITTKSGTAAGTAKKSAAEIAKEIYNGTCSDARWSSWGNGADRVNRLKQAGYDPSEVQSEVNKLF